MSRRAHLTKQTRAYTKVGTGSIEVIVGARDETEDDEITEHAYGWKPMWLKIQQGGRAIYIPLTSYTLEELEAFEKVVGLAIEDAKVISASMDESSLEELHSGAESVLTRALKAAPPYFERPVDLAYKSSESLE